MASKNGWLEPVYRGFTDDGQPIGMFSEEDFEKIRAGYGCPQCWQEFTIIMVKCPVCGKDLSSNLDPSIRPVPDGWAPGPDHDYKMKSRSGG